METDQLRQALKELNGERTLRIAFAHARGPESSAGALTVERAMLIPDEPDHLVKVTDGRSVYIIEAQHVAWIQIELNA